MQTRRLCRGKEYSACMSCKEACSRRPDGNDGGAEEDCYGHETYLTPHKSIVADGNNFIGVALNNFRNQAMFFVMYYM